MGADTAMILGGIAFGAIAILGGGFTAREISVPTVGFVPRVASGVLGVALIAAGLVLALRGEQSGPEAAPFAATATVALSSPSQTTPASTVTVATTMPPTSSGASPATTVAATTSGGSLGGAETAHMDALFRLIPTGMRASCERWDGGPTVSLAAARCPMAEAQFGWSWFASFGSLEDIDRHFDRLSEYELEDAHSEIFDRCRAGENVRSSYFTNGTRRGRLQCYQTESAFWIEWTDDDTRLWGAISSSPESATALFERWRTRG